MLGIASAARSYSRNRERQKTPKQKHSLLRQEHDRGKDRERGETPKQKHSLLQKADNSGTKE